MWGNPQYFCCHWHVATEQFLHWPHVFFVFKQRNNHRQTVSQHFYNGVAKKGREGLRYCDWAPFVFHCPCMQLHRSSLHRAFSYGSFTLKFLPATLDKIGRSWHITTPQNANYTFPIVGTWMLSKIFSKCHPKNVDMAVMDVRSFSLLPKFQKHAC